MRLHMNMKAYVAIIVRCHAYAWQRNRY